MASCYESNGILDESPRTSLRSYLMVCGEMGADVELVERVAAATIAGHRSDQISLEDAELIQNMERQWYDSLNGEPAWDVYGGDYYLGELWACWIMYSRKYLRSIRSTQSLFGVSIVSDIDSVRVVVDLGCGTGCTTAAIKEMFPSARVYGTNLKGTVQARVAEVIGRRFGFVVVADIESINDSVDLVFAFEYFEHFRSPVDHLREVLRLYPGSLLIANTFGSRSIGHFDRYFDLKSGFFGSQSLDGRAISKRFNQELRRCGYEKIDTAVWNDRPSYWKRRREVV